MYHEIISLLGGIKGFASDSASVMKLCLNRPTQAKNTSCLRTLAEPASKTGIYKPLLPSQILKSEKMVTNAIDVITNEYINPFGLDIDKNHLYNLSSGIAIEDSLATEIINLNTIGKELAVTFKQERMLDIECEKICKKFLDPLPRNKMRTFKNSAKTYVIVKDKVKTTVEINRNILRALLSFSAKANRPIDFDSALPYPLSPIPLSLALTDGARRETPKSKLMEIILKGASELSDPTVENPFIRRSTAFVLDMIATTRMMKSIPATYEDVTWQF